MKNPAATSPLSLPALPQPRVAGDMDGTDAGFAPSIHPGPTPSPSPLEDSRGSGLLLSDLPTTHPVLPQAPSPSALPAPPVSASVAAADPAGDDDPMDAMLRTDIDSQLATAANDAAADEDEPMQLSQPARAARSDQRPTMAELLAEQETIRRDQAEVDAARHRVETPKPLAYDIEAIERQYAAGGDWSFIASRMEQARPYELPRAKYDMVIDTGRTFAKTPLQKIMASLSGKHHGNDALEKLFGEYAIGQVSKLPGGNLRVKVKTKEACMLLERTKVNVLGGVFTFKEFDVLGSKFFLDIANVDSDTNTDVILHRLFLLGCKPVYDTFREVNLATGITSATWRVYFLSSTCPSALMVNGAVCDQILFDNKLHPAHGKNAPYQSERLPFGYRSHHGIDLLSTEDEFPRPSLASEQTVTPLQPAQPAPTRTTAKTFAQAAKTGLPKQTSLQKAVEELKKRDGKPQQGALHGKQPAANQLALRVLDVDDSMSISTFKDSAGKMTPPNSPKPQGAPILLLTDGFTTVVNKKKRGRNGIDFSALLVKQQPQPIDGIATPNYFQALQSMEVKLEMKDATSDKKYGVRRQVVPVDVKRPDSVKTANESAFFVEKHHTNIRKAAKATPILKVTESMLDDENTALLNTLPDCLAAADTKVDGVLKVLAKTSNADHITKKAIESPLAFNSALSQMMADSGKEIAELAQIHAINRVMCATQATDDMTFSTKWKKWMSTSVPSTRQEMLKRCAKWWNSSDSICELTRATKALGVFELALMSMAPTVFHNDHWIQYITGEPVEWIPAHHTRLLHPNTLLRLLRSDLGAHCLQHWRGVQWQGHLLDDIEALRKLDGYYPHDSSVLKLQHTWNDVSALTVNTNGIKKNGHLFIQSSLSKYSLSCVQETKLRDNNHLSMFRFHLDSTFQHKLFVNDPNALLNRPSQVRRCGVITVLRSDFPGFDSAVEVSSLSVEGRYLVVRVMVEGSPVYIHNVYAPTDKQQKQRFFESLSTDAFEDDATHLVLGDLNTSLDPQLDSSTPNLRFDASRSSCLEWLAKLGVVDAWRIHHDLKRVFSGPMPRKNRLDYILLSETFCDRFYGSSAYFPPKHAGDHLAHSVGFRTGAQLHGRGYWKFPRHLLDYPKVVSAIEKEAETVRDQLREADNPGKVWEAWKTAIKKQLQDVQKKLRQQDSQAVDDARAALDQAASCYRSSTSDTNRELFDEAMRDFRETISRTSQFNQDAAFDFQAANSEKSTKHFFRPLDTSLRRVSIEEVVTPSGSVSTNPLEISLRFLEHWGSEMGDPSSPAGRAPPPDDELQRTLLDSVTRTVSIDDRTMLDADVTAADLVSAIRHMRATSAPGMDGLTAGFYQVAPDVFGECLAIVFNDRLRRGELLASQRKSAVVLLHKKGSRADPGNYRPIALIPVDVKVLSKALTFRLQQVILDLIHPDQKGFVKGRSIHHHVRFLADLQDLVTSRGEEAYAMFLDFQKAFDRVNWDYMFRLLERMGFGAAFVSWIKLLYTNPQAHLLINQHIQPALRPTRGVKQGDPLSALLFVLTIEPLGNLLRTHEEYGVCLTTDHTVTSIFFADDSTLLASSVTSLQAQLDIVEQYCKGSGAKLNLSKSVLLALNRNDNCPTLPDVQVLCRNETVKYLGIPFGQALVDDGILEFLNKRFYDGFKSWHRRARTLRGRLLVAQTMVLSRLWHYTQHVSIPATIVKRWQSMMNRFVLSRKHDRDATHVQLIPGDWVHAKRSDGGLGVPILDAQLKRQRLSLLLQFIRAARSTGERNWTTASVELLTSVLPRYGGAHALDFLCVSPLRHRELIEWSRTSTWWRETWVWWFKTRWEISWHDLRPDERAAHGLRQPIWFHADPDLHFARAVTSHRRCMGMVPEPQRSLRLHISRVFGLRSLGDFRREGEAWPTEQDFVQRHIDFTLVSVRPGRQAQWLRELHKEATQIVERLGATQLVRDAENARRQSALPHVGCTSGGKVCLVPAVPRSALLRIISPIRSPTKPHPMTVHSQRVDQQQIKAFATFGKRLRKILLPVYEDLAFRLALRLLPVRSRFWFLEASNPRIRYCVRDGCNAIETEQHLLYECTLATQLWSRILQLVSPFFSAQPTWLDIALARKMRVRDEWEACEDVIGDVWHVLRCVTLHFVWNDRNRCLFAGRRPTPALPALSVILTTFCAHIRFFQRRLYEEEDKQTLLRVIRVLKTTPSFKDFVTSHPSFLHARHL